MIEFDIVAEPIVGVLSDMCNIPGSHITLMTIDKTLYIVAMSPEYFKIYNTHQTVPDEFAIRLPKRILKSILLGPCQLNIVIKDNVRIKRYIEASLLSSITLPVEYEQNQDIIQQYISEGAVPHETCALNTIDNLRALIPYSLSGIQFKDNLAYIHTNGYIVYSKMRHPLNFIMTRGNFAELTKFLSMHGDVEIYECCNNIVFKRGSFYFGCRLPVSFIDTEYEQYLQLTPIYQGSFYLGELSRILRNTVIPKHTKPQCTFDLNRGIALINIGSNSEYVISIGGTPVDYVFSVDVDCLKQIFSNTKLSFGTVEIIIYDSFVTFRTNGIDILVRKTLQ